MLAALAGVLNTARLGASDPSFVGLLIELSAITAVVVGGTPLAGGRVRVLGTLTGALLMQLITATIIQHNLPDSVARMIQAVIIVVAVYVQRDRGGIMTAAVDWHAAERRERLAGLAAPARGAPIVLVVVLVIGTGAFGTSFASAQNFSNIALDSSYLVLIAIGMTFVIISGGIDLSVGSVFALAGVLAAYGARWGSLAAVALPLVVCGLIGLANGLLIGRARIAPFIVTLAALLFARGLAFAVVPGGQQGLPHPGRPGADPDRPGQAPRPAARRCSSRWWCSRSGWSCSTAPGSGRRSSPSAAARRRRADGAAGGPGQGAGLRAQRAAGRAAPASWSPPRRRPACRPSARAGSWRRSPPW